MTDLSRPVAAGLKRIESNQDRAVELLATKGFSDVGLREMTASLEVTAGAFYHHFSGKDEYFSFLIEAHYADFLMTVMRSNRTVHRISAAIDAILRLQARRPWYFKLAAREADRLLQLPGASEVMLLRQKINRSLLKALGDPEVQGDPGSACLNLLEHLLIWTADSHLPPREHRAVVERVLIAGIMPSAMTSGT
ncbi:TetR/AcrR family transcriptional regulator; helix-turn-helix transcriptional regulator [Pseudomonas sp. B21-056]|jgi:AcrR family transcriptional regulator|uniref:TetR/AcrR family transcriptional regulator n=1 Tax=Pseudomonas sp. B21-056 TaxID=2895495 RepID=UPI002230C47B|nr:TetR/AcrR family transcriptional regulator [Pseudomonas sp. B21-056]UZE25965.1 TetR/AcrR family transcriptional regulator; helix-turn-helix transcriptional regulator [Pseudomonas sp. B21-056]